MRRAIVGFPVKYDEFTDGEDSRVLLVNKHDQLWNGLSKFVDGPVSLVREMMVLAKDVLCIKTAREDWYHFHKVFYRNTNTTVHFFLIVDPNIDFNVIPYTDTYNFVWSGSDYLPEPHYTDVPYLLRMAVHYAKIWQLDGRDALPEVPLI